jgi:DNA ligase (NAD+)
MYQIKDLKNHMSDSNNLKERLKDLFNQINEANHGYFNQNISKITDAKYDELNKEYQLLLDSLIQKKELSDHEINQYQSLLNQIGADLTQQKEQKEQNQHKEKMLSLDNAFSIADVESFFNKACNFLNFPPLSFQQDFPFQIFCSYKVDGLSLSLTYKNKKLIKALTRGDGTYGENVLHNVNFITSIPKEVTISDEFEVRGEVYIDNADFLNINNEFATQKKFKTPRNLASGTLRALDSKLLLKRPLKFIPWYTNLQTKENILSSRLQFLSTLNFQELPLEIVKNLNDIQNYYHKINLIRSKIQFDIDGLVYKIDDINIQNRLSNTIKSPRWAIAHKFEAQTAITKLNKIILQVGRTGVITPVADLTPINIGGVLITKATLHNLDEIERLSIAEGCLVELKRAGDVIPKIIQVIKTDNYHTLIPYQLPSNCPFCNSPLQKIKEDVAIICTGGKTCPQIEINILKHFVSKDALNIEGLGEKTIELFFNKKFIQNKTDIFELAKYKEEILKEEGFKLKSYTNIITSIENSKNTNLSTLIYALGIKHIGDQASKLLANFFASIENLINFLTELNQQKTDFLTSKNHLDLFNINGIGETTLNSFYEYFKDNSNYEEFKNLLNHLVINHNNQAQNIDKNAKLYGKTFLFTGTLSISRQEAKTKVEKQGGKVLSSISQSLDYLVTGDAAGSKLKKAQELNIKILTEESFNALLNNESINNESQ